MRLVRNFVVAFVRGAGTAVGAFVAKECIQIAGDKHKRACVKQKIKKVKNTILNKDEES